MGPHPSHKTRFSWDASTYDEICEICGATDEVPGGWGRLALPCSGEREKGCGCEWCRGVNNLREGEGK